MSKVDINSLKQDLDSIPSVYPFTVLERQHVEAQVCDTLISFLQVVAVGDLKVGDVVSQLQALVQKYPETTRIHCNLADSNYYDMVKKKNFPNNVSLHLTEPPAKPAYCPKNAVFCVDAWPNSAYSQSNGSFVEYPVDTIVMSDEDLQQLKVLGSGTTSIVYEYKYPYISEECVIKAYQPHVLDACSRSIVRETKSLLKVHHPNVVPLFAVVLSTKQFIPRGLVLERMKWTLAQYLNQQKPTWQEVLPLLAQVAAGVAYLHQKNVLHLDIKPENVMLNHSCRIAKITDFGTAQVKTTLSTLRSAHGEGEPRGTRLYQDPRYALQEEGTPDKACDVFSFAMMMWEATHWGEPHKLGKSEGQILISLCNGKRPGINASALPPEITEIIERCWIHDASQRFTMSGIEHKLAAFTKGASPTPVTTSNNESTCSLTVQILLGPDQNGNPLLLDMKTGKCRCGRDIFQHVNETSKQGSEVTPEAPAQDRNGSNLPPPISSPETVVTPIAFYETGQCSFLSCYSFLKVFPFYASQNKKLRYCCLECVEDNFEEQILFNNSYNDDLPKGANAEGTAAFIGMKYYRDSSHNYDLSQIRHLYVHKYSDVTGEDLVQKAPHLVSLMLKLARGLDDMDIKGLSKFQQLLALYVVWSGHENAVSDVGISRLSALTQLQYLTLTYFPNVSDEGLKFVKHLTQLQYLDIYCSKMTDAALWQMQGLKYLRWLCVNGRGITDHGVAYLTKLQKLKHLSISYTSITDEGVKLLSTSLPLLEYLNLDYSEQMTTAALVFLKDFPVLQHLDISSLDYSQVLDDAAFLHLKEIKLLKYLNLSYNAISVTSDWLRQFTQLQHLRISSPRIHGCSMDDIFKGGFSKNLRVLDLSHCLETTDIGLAMLGELAQLRCLVLERCGITDAGIAATLGGLKELTKLNLCQCEKLTDAAVKHIAEHVEDKLVYLDLHNCDVTDACIADLQRMKPLEQLRLWNTKITKEGVEKLKAALPTTWIESNCR